MRTIPEPYNLINLPLDTAQTDKEFQIPGTFLEFATDGVMTGITVRIGFKKADAIPLDRFKAIRFPFGRIEAPEPNFVTFPKFGFTEFYVTWTAQAGKTLYIFIGRDGAETRRV